MGSHRIQDLHVTCHLGTPMAGPAPAMEGILIYCQDALEHSGHGRIDYNRQTAAKELPPPSTSIGLDLFKLGEFYLYCCSAPIYRVISAKVDHLGTRFDWSSCRRALGPGQSQHATDISGPHKPRYIPIQLYVVPIIHWFVRGNADRLRELLNACHNIGQYRREGYGQITYWGIEESTIGPAWYTVDPPDNTDAVKPVLMRPVPATTTECPYSGATLGHGAVMPPFWHRARQIDIWQPV
jgi:hypothetical protein